MTVLSIYYILQNLHLIIKNTLEYWINNTSNINNENTLYDVGFYNYIYKWRYSSSENILQLNNKR